MAQEEEIGDYGGYWGFGEEETEARSNFTA